jgi:hypothetical protein
MFGTAGTPIPIPPSPLSLSLAYKAARFTVVLTIGTRESCAAISPHVKIPSVCRNSNLNLRLSGSPYLGACRTAPVSQGGRSNCCIVKFGIRTPKSIHAPHLPHPTPSRLDWLPEFGAIRTAPVPPESSCSSTHSALVHEEEVQVLHQRALSLLSSHSIASQNNGL